MSASLFGERFAGRREPAWHRLGEVFPQEEKVSASEGMRKADIARYVEQFDRLGTIDDADSLDETIPGGTGNPTIGDAHHRQRSNSNIKNLMQKVSADMSGMFIKK